MSIPISIVKWPKSYRLIPSKYPPIDLFDDIAAPEDWEDLARAESRTNPRIYEEIGDISLIPKERRISGAGAGWVISAFTHVSKARPTRFTDGSYGVYYCSKDFETALYETVFHQSIFLSATKQEAGWITVMRELIAKIDNEFHDIRDNGYQDELNPDNYEKSHMLAKNLRSANSNGIVFPSVRKQEGECLAAFWPDVVSIPTQGSHWQYHWDGKKFDYVKQLDNNAGPPKVYKL